MLKRNSNQSEFLVTKKVRFEDQQQDTTTLPLASEAKSKQEKQQVKEMFNNINKMVAGLRLTNQ